MRMAALSRASGVPVPTIKFYLREGLLPPGLRTSPNQSQYDDEHVRRLGLIRSLTELGGCSLADVAEIVRAAIDPAVPPAGVSAILSRTVTHKLTDHPVQPRFQLVDAVMREHGWRLTDNDEHRLTAATLLGLMQSLDLHHTATSMRAYAAAATLTADAKPGREGDRDAERAVLATVLDDALIASLRRMAEVSVREAALAPAAPMPSDAR
ncbi:MAG: MerR family transcriptional regulator [Nakamurella sp.]